MKRRFQRAILLTVTALFTSAVISACYTAVGEPEERETLKVEIFDRTNSGSGYSDNGENYLTQWIQREFGDQNGIDVEFVLTSRDRETEMLNQYLATDSGPDLVFTYNPYYVRTYIENGKITDLTELTTEENAPSLNQFLGESVLDLGKVDGRQYVVPAKRMLKGKFASFIRKDWLDRLGFSVPSTTEELVEVLRAFKANSNVLSGDDTIPFSSPGGNSMAVRTIADNACINDKNDDAIYFISDGYKDAVKFMRELYRDGLLGSYYVEGASTDKHYSNITAGNVGFFVDALSDTAFTRLISLFDILKANDNDAEYVVCDPFTNSEGKHYKDVYDENGMYIFVPTYSEKAELAVKYLDWLSQPDVIETLQHGIEGEHYQKDGNNYIPIDDEKNSEDLSGSFDVEIIINGYNAENEEESVSRMAETYGDYGELFKQAYATSAHDGVMNEPKLENMDTLRRIDEIGHSIDDFWIEAVVASDEEFDKTYSEISGRCKEILGVN